MGAEMNKILKIDGVRNISKNNSDYTVYIFNNDKIVRVNSDTGEVITKNVPETYLNLISVYSATEESVKKNSSTNKESDTDEEMINEKIQYIMSGSGAGLGVFLGFLNYLTIIGPFIAAAFAFIFSSNISDRDYLLRTKARSLNFQKGFYSSICFGIFGVLNCCSQWKLDMTSVLNGKPTKASQDKHVTYKVLLIINIIFWLFYIISNTYM